MIKRNLKSYLKVTSFLLLGSFFLFNCEPESDDLGEQFFLGNAAAGNESAYDVVAYHINNNDTIRSDYSRLPNTAILGAFTEGVFGRQKASYVSQVRMNSYDPDFGVNPEVDSVVMVLNSTFAADSVETITTEDFIFPGDIAAKKVINKYPVFKSGKSKINGKTLFNIRVHEVDEFLKSTTDEYYSDQVIAFNATEIGSKVFDGYVNSTDITKDSDNSSLFKHDASLRIPLDATFFQNKIIAKQDAAELQDAANFIRYFKGVRISVDENDGYLFDFNPFNAKIIMYYSKGAADDRTQSTLDINMGGTSNVHIGQYEYERAGSAAAEGLATSNMITGDKKLYVQGMGGPSIGIRIPDETIALLRSKVNDEKIGIVSAKIRIFTDTSIWNNNYPKPNTFTFLMKEATAFVDDMSVFSNYRFGNVFGYDLDQNAAYYDIMVTKTLKDIVEEDEANTDFEVGMGNFVINSSLASSSQPLYGYQFTTRPVSPYRMVLVGTDPTNDHRIQLKITYGSK